MEQPVFTTVTVNGYYTLLIACIVLLFGRQLVRRIRFLRDFNIPEPVAGGLVAAAIIYILYGFGSYIFKFDAGLKMPSCSSFSPLSGSVPIFPA